MNNEIQRKPKYHNRFIVPVFSIALFLISIMSVSYGYFTWWGTVGTVKATGTDTYSSRCMLSTSGGLGSYTVNASYDMTPGRWSSTNREVGHYNLPANIILNGPNTCQCNYQVLLKLDNTNYDTYVKTTGATKEFTYKISASTGAASPNSTSVTSTERNYDVACSTAGGTGDMATGCALGSGTIKVITSSTPVQHTWYLESKFYYISTLNQTALVNKTFGPTLLLKVTDCTF